MTVPSPIVFIVLCLAAYRAWRLIARDDITAGARTRLLGMTDHEWGWWSWAVKMQTDERVDPWHHVDDGFSFREWLGAQAPDPYPYPLFADDRDDGIPPVSSRRFYLAKFVHCPWCLGAWIAFAITAAWTIHAGGDVWDWLAVGAAVSAVVGLVAQVDAS